MDSKQVKKTGMTPDEFQDSITALLQHNPKPMVKVALALKSDTLAYGQYVEFYKELMALIREHGVEIATTIRGEWPEGADTAQLTLFAPSRLTPMDDQDWDQLMGKGPA